MSDIPYMEVNEYPEEISASKIIVRLLDGLGYRFRYATENLQPGDYEFSTGKGCKTIGEITFHIWGLVNWICMNVMGQQENRPKDVSEQRVHILAITMKLRQYFDNISDDQLEKINIEGKPFWHIINGPISDALTHAGQINIIRRLAGNKPVKSNVFTLELP